MNTKKKKQKLLMVAAVLIVAFLSMAGSSCPIPGTDWSCNFDQNQINCFNKE